MGELKMIDLKKNHEQLTPKPAGIGPYVPETTTPDNFSSFEYLAYQDQITPEMVESLKQNYARALERFYLNFRTMMMFDIQEWKPEWIIWTYCKLPALCSEYTQFFRLLRKIGTMNFMERELNRGFYLIEHIFEVENGGKQE
jgi:hypothetical protein